MGEQSLMNSNAIKKIGLIIGDEQDWPEAVLNTINQQDRFSAELVKLGATFMDSPVTYDLIIDRISHEIPYYRAFLKYAVSQGVYIINNPFTWSADSRFFGIALVNKLGLTSPRTAVLPNKEVEMDAKPSSFRNLRYPMKWQEIIDYVGVPAIFKDIHSGGRRPVHRVTNVDELLQRYDESGTRTTILQQIIESDIHIHCFVFGQENVLALRYSLKDGRYLPESISPDDPTYQHLSQSALTLSQVYKYDINMVEFVIQDDTTYVINGTNPAPVIDRQLMTDEQFNWCVQESVNAALERAKQPLAQQPVSLNR